MFGVFGLFNLLIGSVYPLVASYKAYDNYSRLATKTGATTFNVGGVSIPLGTLLKKATTADAQIEEDTLNYRLLSVQMWLIYWMVDAAVCTAERVLCLSWLPLYSTARCAFSLWLIAPIVVSSARLKSSQVLSFNDVQQEWASFSGQGCGLVYFKYLQPFFKENLGLLSRLSIEPLLATISSKLVLPLAQSIGISALLSRDQSQTRSSNTETFSGYTRMFGSGRTPQGPELSSSTYGDISEYDVVDKPSSEEDEIKPRGSMNPEAAGVSSASSTSAARQTWFW